MRSYSVLKFADLPDDEVFVVNASMPLGVTPLATKFYRTDRLVHTLPFDRYDIEHYSRVKFRGIPYSAGEVVDEVTEKHSFPAYLSRNEELLVVRYAKRVVDELIGRVNKELPNANLHRRVIDIQGARPMFLGITGGYFGDIIEPHLRAGALFGTNVDEATMFEMMSSRGRLNAVIAQVQLGEAEYNCLIGDDYTFCLYEELPEWRDLSVILQLVQLLEGYASEPLRIRERAQDAEELEESEQQLVLDMNGLA